jgi:hypothetical protein
MYMSAITTPQVEESIHLLSSKKQMQPVSILMGNVAIGSRFFPVIFFPAV